MSSSGNRGLQQTWDQVVKTTDHLEGPLWWIRSMRVDILEFRLMWADAPWLRRLRLIGYHWLQVTWRLCVILLSVLKGTVPLDEIDSARLFLVDVNPSYLTVLRPVISRSIKDGKRVLLLTRTRQMEVMRGIFGDEIASGRAGLLAYSDLARFLSRRRRIINMSAAVYGCAADVLVWLRSGVSRRVELTPRLATHSLVNRFYSEPAGLLLAGQALVVAANDHHMWETLVCREARDAGTPSVVLQHGVPGPFWVPMIADRLMVWSEHDREVLSSRYGADSASLQVVGNPGFDHLVQDDAGTGTDPGTKVTFLSQAHGAAYAGAEQYSQIVEMFYRLASENSALGLEFVVKLHHFDDENYFEPFSRRYPGSVNLVRGNLLDLLEKSVVVVLKDSTAVYEAALMNVPIIQVAPEGAFIYSDYSGHNLATMCRTYASLAAVFSSLTGGREQMAQARERTGKALGYYLAHRGRSVDVVVEALRGLER